MVARMALCTIVVHEDGNRNFPYANENGKRWSENWNWTDNSLNRNGRVAVVGKWRKYYQRRCSARMACFNQPPSILPISLSFSDKRPYCFVEMPLISQSIWSRNFNRSNFVFAF